MADLDDSFAKLLGRLPSEVEREELYRVRDALGLKNNDALWLVLMALQYYEHSYSKFPELIRKSAADTLRGFNATADATLAASAEAAKADLAKAVAAAAEKVAKDTASRLRWQWLLATFVVVLAGLLGAGRYVDERARTAGYNSGYGSGYKEAKDEKAAAAWANTPEGRLAYRFAQSGELTKVARCLNKGWQIKGPNCYPYPAVPEGTYGWRMP